jgi:hypothetical protein
MLCAIFTTKINNPAAEQRGMLFSKGIGLRFNTSLTAPEGRGIKPSPRIKIDPKYFQKHLTM